MTELEALKVVFGRAKQVPDVDPELQEALQIVDRLITTVEQAEEDPYRTCLLAEDVLRQIGITIVTYIFADDVRFYFTQKGFENLEAKLSNQEIAQEVHGQIKEVDLPMAFEDWAVAIECAAARALVRKAGLDWPEP